MSIHHLVFLVFQHVSRQTFVLVDSVVIYEMAVLIIFIQMKLTVIKKCCVHDDLSCL